MVGWREGRKALVSRTAVRDGDCPSLDGGRIGSEEGAIKTTEQDQGERGGAVCRGFSRLLVEVAEMAQILRNGDSVALLVPACGGDVGQGGMTEQQENRQRETGGGRG